MLSINSFDINKKINLSFCNSKKTQKAFMEPERLKNFIPEKQLKSGNSLTSFVRKLALVIGMGANILLGGYALGQVSKLPEKNAKNVDNHLNKKLAALADSLGLTSNIKGQLLDSLVILEQGKRFQKFKAIKIDYKNSSENKLVIKEAIFNNQSEIGKAKADEYNIISIYNEGNDLGVKIDKCYDDKYIKTKKSNPVKYSLKFEDGNLLKARYGAVDKINVIDENLKPLLDVHYSEYFNSIKVLFKSFR